MNLFGVKMNEKLSGELETSGNDSDTTATYRDWGKQLMAKGCLANNNATEHGTKQRRAIKDRMMSCVAFRIVVVWLMNRGRDEDTVDTIIIVLHKGWRLELFICDVRQYETCWSDYDYYY